MAIFYFPFSIAIFQFLRNQFPNPIMSDDTGGDNYNETRGYNKYETSNKTAYRRCGG